MKKPTLIETTENGKRVSPKLPPGMKNFLIDIDGTVGEDIPNEEPWRMADAEVFPEAVAKLNAWYDEGHIITFFTSRTEEHRAVTEQWLNRHGFKYHGMVMGKPRGGNYHWIDDREVRATRYEGHFTDLVERSATVQVFGEH
ncbi:MAG: phosphoheptose isomerase [Flavobacteriales bacterium]|nr:phosphoheptose isomerase [Flavobacteriales bacterium]